MAVIAAWVHDEDKIPAHFLPDDPDDLKNMVVHTAMIASVLLRGWANNAGVPATTLLGDIAISQALVDHEVDEK